MTLADLKAYRPKAAPGLCRPYRVYIVCVPGAPSGGPAVLEALGILQHTDIGKDPNDVEGWYLFSQASRLMYADRDRYIADPDFVDVPVDGLLDPTYLAQRAKLIGPSPPPRWLPASPGAPASARPTPPRRSRAPPTWSSSTSGAMWCR